MLRTEYKVLLAIGTCIVCGAIIWQVVENSRAPAPSNANFVAAPSGAQKGTATPPASTAGRNQPAPRLPSPAGTTGGTGITPVGGDRPAGDIASRSQPGATPGGTTPPPAPSPTSSGLPPLAGDGVSRTTVPDVTGAGEPPTLRPGARETAPGQTPPTTSTGDLPVPGGVTPTVGAGRGTLDPNAGRLAGDSVPTPTTPDTIGGVSVPPRNPTPTGRNESGSGAPMGTTPTGTSPGSVLPKAGKPSPTPGASATYTVQAGDTLMKIAEKYYGDKRQWTRIRDANKGLNPNRIAAGQVLTLPAKEGAGGGKTGVTGGSLASGATPAKPSGDTTKAATGPDAKTATIPPAGTAKSPTVHRVAAGETLQALAKKYLKSERRWREIYELNRALLRSPDALEIGMQLRIPPLSNAESGKPAESDAKRKSNSAGNAKPSGSPGDAKPPSRVSRVP